MLIFFQRTKNFAGKTAKEMIKTNSALLRMDNLSYSR